MAFLDETGLAYFWQQIVAKIPVKGTDYWTEADKAEIVADTLAALPTWTGGNY